ncbi:MAG TPA: RNA polymerase sigma factor [Actinomycetota bacterium]|nr:RNA polymerase sigma factor [Actinomycetota bacterium]
MPPEPDPANLSTSPCVPWSEVAFRRGEVVLDEPDPKVIHAARAGDPAAFETIVRTYQVDVWRFCAHLLRDDDAAADVAQEAFVRAYRFLRRYRGDSKFSTWLFSVVRNCALDELRRSARRRRTGDLLGAQPARRATDHTVGVEVREAVVALPLPLRECVVLVDVFGLPYRDAAALAGVPEGTVKSRVHRARELLADALGPAVEERAGDA